MISLVANNFLLVTGLEAAIQNIQGFNCNPSFLIIDTTAPESLKKLESINLITLCGIFMLVNNTKEIYLLQHLDFSCPVIFLDLSVGVEEISSKVNNFIADSKIKKNCHYNICHYPYHKKIPKNELTAIRMFFMGEDVLRISIELCVEKKTVLNYIRKALVRLNLKINVESYNLFKTYEYFAIHAQLGCAKKNCLYEGVECLLKKNRIRIIMSA